MRPFSTFDIAPKHRPSAVIFDWDFTLSEHNGRRLQNFLEDAHQRLKGAQVTASHVTAVADVTTSADKKPPKSTLKDGMVRSYYKLNDIRLIDGSAQLIESLLAQQIPVLIVSNAPHGVVEEYANKLLGQELAARINIYGTDREDHVRKPSKQAFDLPLKKHGIAVDKSVFVVGDRFEYDYKPAFELGLTPILFNPTRECLQRAKSFAEQEGHDLKQANTHWEVAELLGQKETFAERMQPKSAAKQWHR